MHMLHCVLSKVLDLHCNGSCILKHASLCLPGTFMLALKLTTAEPCVHLQHVQLKQWYVYLVDRSLTCKIETFRQISEAICELSATHLAQP